MEDDYFPHLSLMYGVDSKEEGRIANEIIRELEERGEAGQDGERYQVKGMYKFAAKEVWCVRCEGKVEDWEVLGKVKL